MSRLAIRTLRYLEAGRLQNKSEHASALLAREPLKALKVRRKTALVIALGCVKKKRDGLLAAGGYEHCSIREERVCPSQESLYRLDEGERSAEA